MRATFAALLSAIAIAGAAAPASAAVPVQRFVLVVGANLGGGDRVNCSYAISDAERFARVMLARRRATGQRSRAAAAKAQGTRRRPRRAQRARCRGAPRQGAGADRSDRLLLGPRRRTGAPHRQRSLCLSHAPRPARSDSGRRPNRRPRRVRVGRLHAAQRRQGAPAVPRRRVRRHARPRVPDVERRNRVGAGIRSHPRLVLHALPHLGLPRRRRSLRRRQDPRSNEAYQFAFNETLGRTVDTRGGAQHPSYDINLSRLRRRRHDRRPPDDGNEALVLGEEARGALLHPAAPRSELVVELYKPYPGRKIELGIEPGALRGAPRARPGEAVDAGEDARRGRRDGDARAEAVRAGDAGTHDETGRRRRGTARGRGAASYRPVRRRCSRVRQLLAAGGWHPASSSAPRRMFSGGLQFTTFPREDLAGHLRHRGARRGRGRRGQQEQRVIHRHGDSSRFPSAYAGIRSPPVIRPPQ